MHLLCFIAGCEAAAAEPTLQRVQRVVQTTLPPFPLPFSSSITLLPEIRGGWMVLAPSNHMLRARLGTLVEPDVAVLFYGELFDPDSANAVATVVRAWRAGGARAVQDLDGCFSAIVVERNIRRCTVVSDLLGRRTLRYVEQNGSLIVASHDIPLIAAARIRPSINMSAARSSCAMGWALGGMPLLGGISICEPDTVLEYQDRTLTLHTGSRLRLPSLPEASAAATVRDVTEKMIDHLHSIITTVAGASAEVKTDLTAGMDTRFLLALLVSVIQKDRIVAGTEGQESDLDVIVAKRIARAAGIRHVIDFHPKPQPEKFLEGLDILAFTVNGDTDSKRATTNLFQRAEFVDPVPRFYGTASEFYRGACYPMNSRRELMRMSHEDVLQWNIYSWTKLSSLRWKEEESREEVLHLMRERHARYESLCRAPVDLVDLFYIFERFGRWGAFSARATWWAQYFTPFGSPTLVKLACQLPPPLGFGARIHRAFIRRYLPKSYYAPLTNGAWFLPLLGYPRVAGRLSTTIQSLDAFRAMLRRTFKRAGDGYLGDQDLWSAAQIASAIRPVAQSLLFSSGSIAPRFFSVEELERMLNDLGRSDRYLTTISSLLTMERWREQTERAATLAADQSPGN